MNNFVKMLMALMFVLVFALPGMAQSWNIGSPNLTSVTATLSEDRGTLTISGTGAMMEDYSSWAWGGFNTTITTVIIEVGVTYIGSGAFRGFINLTSITIPNSVTSIGGQVFWGCTGLTSITIPNSVTSIGNQVFWGCTGLTSITIGNGVTAIAGAGFGHGAGEFSGCTGLMSINVAPDNPNFSSENGVLFNKNRTVLIVYPSGKQGAYSIPASVTGIERLAFYSCTGLTSVTIPNSVNWIGNSAFARCTGLTSITIPNGVTWIGEGAFSVCTGLKSVTIPVGWTTTIGDGVFSGCTNIESVAITGTGAMTNFFSRPPWYDSRNSITNVIIGNGITTIGANAFLGCTGLTSITIPNGVTSILSRAFQGCTGLTSITIPNGVTWIENSAFWDCTGLTSINVAPNNPNFSSEDGILFNKDKTALILYPPGRQGAYTIPNSVTSIGALAFSGCTGLTSITIPDSVTSIGSSAFSGCIGLTSITIPNSVTSIGDLAFSSCTGLTSINVAPNNHNFSSEDGILFNKDKTALILYPPGRQGAYTIPNSVTSIGDRAFSGCTGLTSITIPNSVTSIGSSAFVACTRLTSITIPNSVITIGSWAFSNCTGLTSVTIGNNVTTIESSAFQSCTGLTSIISLNAIPPTLGSLVFNNINASACLYVPQNNIDAYRGAIQWRNFNCINSASVVGYPTVTFDSQDGSIIIPQTVLIDNKAAKPADPTRPNHVFGGWYKEAAYINPWDFDIDIVTADVTLYAKWKLNTYVVTFVDGLGNEIVVRTVDHGANATPPDNPIRETHNFTGWSGDYTNVTNDRTITALWEIKTYAVTFVDGLGNEIVVRTVNHGANATPPDNPIRETHNFTNWSGDYTNVTSTRTITALWEIKTYAVTFVDGLGNEIIVRTVDHGANATPPDNPIRETHNFTNWSGDYTNVTSTRTITALWEIKTFVVTFVDGLGNEIVVRTVDHGANATPPDNPIRETHNFTNWSGDYTNVTSTRTITALWEIKTYAVTFVDGLGNEIVVRTVDHGANATPPDNPLRETHNFTDWSGDYTNVTSDRTITALWEIKTYSVTFVDGLGNEIVVRTVNHGANATPPANPTRETHNFTGWDNGFDNVTSDLIVTAQWTIKSYTVTFVNGIGTTLKTENVNYGSFAIAPATPFRTGYTFTGWDIVFTNVTGNLTVTAQWTIINSQDNTDITATRTMIEGVRFGPVAQSVLNSQGMARGFVEDAIAELNLNGVSAVVTAVGFRAAFNGTDGSYTFRVTLNKGAGTQQMTGILELVISATPVSVLSPDRIVPNPQQPNKEEFVHITILVGEFTAGPNPVARSAGSVTFFRQGKWVQSAMLTIFDASGNVVNKIRITDNAINTQERRKVGFWDLTDRRGRMVSEGTYLVRGVVTTADGKRERVSVLVGVQ